MSVPLNRIDFDQHMTSIKARVLIPRIRGENASALGLMSRKEISYFRGAISKLMARADADDYALVISLWLLSAFVGRASDGNRTYVASLSVLGLGVAWELADQHV